MRNKALLIGWVGTVSMSVWMLIDFIRAYFSSGQTISVNRFGEGNVEFVLLISLLPFIAFFVLNSYQKIMSDKEKVRL